MSESEWIIGVIYGILALFLLYHFIRGGVE